MSLRLAAPALLGIVMLTLWEGVVRVAAIPPYILPGPLLIAETLATDWSALLPSLWVTLEITLEALAAAVIVGGLLAVLFSLLIGAVVAEFVAGTGGNATGLAWRILESSYQLMIPHMFAALFLISATGIAIFLLLTLLPHLLLRHWHESALEIER